MKLETRLAYCRFVADQMVGAVLSVVIGSWVAVSAWRAEAAEMQRREDRKTRRMSA